MFDCFLSDNLRFDSIEVSWINFSIPLAISTEVGCPLCCYFKNYMLHDMSACVCFKLNLYNVGKLMVFLQVSI